MAFKLNYADVIAVPGNPLDDITALERVRSVMKNGEVVRK
jgi:imidazolonepropionase-like amidohydrolase